MKIKQLPTGTLSVNTYYVLDEASQKDSSWIPAAMTPG